MCEYLPLQYTRKHKKYVAVSNLAIHDETSDVYVNIYWCSTWWNSGNMYLYLDLQYTRKNQKYVAVSSSSCTATHETSEICVSIYFCSTRGNIRNMWQYLVLQYTRKHQMYVPISSCTVPDETSEICGGFSFTVNE